MKQLTAAQISNMRFAGKVLADTFKHIRQNLHAGMTTRDVDKLAENYILQQGCYPCFKGVYDYQYACNTSVNEMVTSLLLIVVQDLTVFALMLVVHLLLVKFRHKHKN